MYKMHYNPLKNTMEMKWDNKAFSNNYYPRNNNINFNTNTYKPYKSPFDADPISSQSIGTGLVYSPQ